ncbi:hypothetical protein LTR78_000785 [Recurvomyces mirabilis]|uniref:Heterokaryon incompatibility domain-containing protein n=1 Tax=Recurvomyces mirabilis TaxID=574656 RepID=A0AAE1C5V4_9PEZI|nr:hypothetical protein LTR78_000785 [Recurvomyces mirabilis]KAK5158754.1 hypothetical protein LTS14_002862 [Recurvomyces mirabilis]
MSERSEQVALMKDLYVKAQVVHIWLGPGLDDAKNLAAMALMKAIHQGTPPQDVLGHSDDTGGASQMLTTAPYWDRLWVIQEAVLAQEPRAYLGEACSPFWDLLEAFTQLTLAERDGQVPPTGLNPLAVLRMRTAKAVQSLKTHEPGPLSVLHVCSLLQATSVAETKEEHDRVFGLLGLLPDYTGLTPDYSLDVADLYTYTVSRLMEELGSLHLLAYAGVYPGRRVGLPSWSLDFAKIKNLGVYANWTFRADAAIEVKSGIISNRRATKYLGVRARAFDTVTWFGPPCPDLKFPEDLESTSEHSLRLQEVLLNWRLELGTRTEGKFDQRKVSLVFRRTVTNDTIYTKYEGVQHERR